jgi:hypothetical protein
LLPNVSSENPFYRSALQNIKRERKLAEIKMQQTAVEEGKQIVQEDPKDENKSDKITENIEFLDVSA